MQNYIITCYAASLTREPAMGILDRLLRRKQVDLPAAILDAYRRHVKKIAGLQGTAPFVAQYLEDSQTISQLVPLAAEKLELAATDGVAHSASFEEHDVLLFMVHALPLPMKDAPGWFTREYGSYLWFECKVTDGPIYELRPCKAMVHLVVGADMSGRRDMLRP